MDILFLKGLQKVYSIKSEDWRFDTSTPAVQQLPRTTIVKRIILRPKLSELLWFENGLDKY